MEFYIYQKNNMKYFVSYIIGLFICIQSFAQTTPGIWSDYFEFKSVKQIIPVDDDIYCLTENGIWTYSQKSSEMKTYTKIEGLSSVNIMSFEYSKELHKIYLGYKNGIFDIFDCETKSIKRISSIKNESIFGSKAINSFSFIKDNVYISTDFGLVVFNPISEKFSSTTIFGESGNYVPIYDITHNENNDSIFVASENGILGTDVNSNLPDISAWNKLKNIPYANNKISGIEYVNNSLYYYHTSDSTKYDSLFKIKNHKVDAFKTQIPHLSKIKRQGDSLIICGKYNVRVYDKNDYLKYSHDTLADKVSEYYYDFSFDKNGNPWIGDLKNGLYNVKEDIRTSPNGPLSNVVGDIYFENGNLYYVAGRFGLYKYGMFSVLLPNNTWYSHTNWQIRNSASVYAEPNSKTYYYGSLGWGAVQGTNSWTYDSVYNSTNSAIQNLYDNNTSSAGERISDITADSEGNIWFANTLTWNPLVVKTNTGDWFSFRIPGTSNNLHNDIKQLQVSSSDHIWVAGLNRLVVFNPNSTLNSTYDDEYTIINLSDSEGVIASNTTCLAEDNEGDMWIGTSQGIAIHTNPSRVFNDGYKSISRIKIEIDGEIGYLLSSDYITTIAVDKANRKWVGTQNSGVFVISAEGTEQIKHYTIDNSPLPSNYIIAIDINDENGEVFIGTEEGLVSVIGEATNPSKKLDSVYITPNPVRPNHTGDIYIRNTPENATFKITTISGKLVFEDETLGGTGVWDGNNLRGERVQTGVYFIYISNNDGSLSTVTKVAFIN